METELGKPDLEAILSYYDVDTSYLSETGWSRRKINCISNGHDDRSPSMSVNLEDGRVKCWSCGFSGDGYDVIQEKEGVDFVGARKWAADHLGITDSKVRGSSNGQRPGRWTPPWVDEDD